MSKKRIRISAIATSSINKRKVRQCNGQLNVVERSTAFINQQTKTFGYNHVAFLVN